jgi:hypothetical protein
MTFTQQPNHFESAITFMVPFGCTFFSRYLEKIKNSLVAVSVVGGGGGGGDADGHRLAHRAQGGRLRRCRLAHDAEARHLGPLVRRRRVQTQKSVFFSKLIFFFKLKK